MRQSANINYFYLTLSLLQVLACQRLEPVSTQSILSSSSINGSTLYAHNCASCHNPLATSTKRNRTESQIRNAISTQPSMNFLSGLSSVQLQAIASVLGTSGGDTNSTKAGIRPVIGTRTFVASQFEDVFVPDTGRNSEDTAILNTIKQLIRDQVAAFGGNCTAYDGADKCPGDLDQNAYVEMLPATSTIRKGYLLRACDEILSRDRAVQTLLNKAGSLTVSSPATAQNIESVFSVFSPGRHLSSTAKINIANVYTSAKARSMSDTDAWRFTILPICKSTLAELN